MGITHSPECIERDAKLKKLHEDWVSRWPNYCKSCDGAGSWTDYENLGDGLGGMPVTNFCDDCVGIGKCSRCGTGLDPESDDGPCSFCSWNYDDFCPPQYLDGPCECWEQSDIEISSALEEIESLQQYYNS